VEGQPVDKEAGEWRCQCSPCKTFDTSVNPVWVAKCNRCGMRREEASGDDRPAGREGG
jgi:uncharacterized protein (DUF983 family)